MSTEKMEPVAWLVVDSIGQVMHAAGWEAAAHEHINDAITEYDLQEAAHWRVLPVHTAAQLQAAVAAERERCAKVCEERMSYWRRDDIRRLEDECCAEAIRQLGDEQ